MPGSLLVKDFKGRTIVVKVLDDGFEYDGRRFASLTAVQAEFPMGFAQTAEFAPVAKAIDSVFRSLRIQVVISTPTLRTR
jgi:hypothetical protein